MKGGTLGSEAARFLQKKKNHRFAFLSSLAHKFTSLQVNFLQVRRRTLSHQLVSSKLRKKTRRHTCVLLIIIFRKFPYKELNAKYHVLFCRVNNETRRNVNFVKTELGGTSQWESGDMNMFVIAGFNVLVWLCLAAV